MAGKTKKPMNKFLVILLIVLLITGVTVGILIATGVINITGQSVTDFDDDVPVVDTKAYVYAEDAALNLATLEVNYTNFAVYEWDISLKTVEQIEDGRNTLANYVKVRDLAVGQYFELDTDCIYWMVATLTGFVNQSFVPTYTDNTVRMMNLTADVEMLAFNNSLSTTINQTDSRDWSILAQTVDAAGNASAAEGYSSNYNFLTDTYSYVVVRVEFNTTTSNLAYCALVGMEANEIISGNYTYYEIPMELAGLETINLKFNTAIGVTYEVIGISLGYGNAEAFTAWDSQN